MLHGDEVALPQVAGRPVVARSGGIVRIHLDEALPALAQQADRHQPHLGLQLLLDVGDEGGPVVIVEGDRSLIGGPSARAQDLRVVPLTERADFGPQRGNLVILAGRRLARRQEAAETKENDAR